MKPNGEWEISDEQVDKEIAHYSLTELIRLGQAHREAARRECTQFLSSARRQAVSPGAEWDLAAHRKVYDAIASEHPHCLSLLDLLPPELDPKLRGSPANEANSRENKSPLDKMSALDKFLIQDACFDRKVSTAICSEVISLFIPVGAVGTATKSVAKIATSGGRSARAIAKVEKAGSAATNASKSPEVVRLVKDYKDRVFSSESENLAFISKAKSANGNTHFVVVENTMMKKLNTVVGDKDTVTALTNLHKSILLRRLDDLKRKYPDIEFTVYNDFKSTDIAMTERKALSAEIRAQLTKDIDDLLKAANREFAGEVRKLNLKSTSAAGDPAQWFKGGMDTDFEKASFRAREARGSKETGLYNADVDAMAADYLRSIESQRQAIASSPQFKRLMDEEGLVPKPEVLDLTRKFSDPEELARFVRDSYQVSEFSAKEAAQLMSYASEVDRFSPSLLIAKREVLSLDNAIHGGTSMDVPGLGGENLHATARGLVGTTSLRAAQSAARAGEERVTQEFRQKLAKIREVAGPGTRCSGDDCVQVASRAMSLDEKAKIVSRMADTPEIKKLRIAFFGENVPAHARMQIASHGELIEKNLRKELNGKIDPRKLENLVFGLDMQTTTANSGQVNLIVGRARGVSLTAKERQALNEAFQKSLIKYNEDIRSYQSGFLVTRDRQIYLIPVPLSEDRLFSD